VAIRRKLACFNAWGKGLISRRALGYKDALSLESVKILVLARLIYVTSQTILPSIIDYYLDLLRGVIPSHARQRLSSPITHDGSVRPISDKLLERPRLIERIRSLIMDADRAHRVPFNTTNREKELALRLGIPMYGADPKFFPLGPKSG
jgi:hypothetical protein